MTINNFIHSTLYPDGEQTTAYERHIWITKDTISNRSRLVIGMVWYSSLKEQVELGWVSTTEYETFASDLYRKVLADIREQFPNITLASIDGASDMWIDKPLIQTRLQTWMPWLSFSCPEYIKYVKDIPGNNIFLSQDAHTYLENYARCADIMIVVGWRDAAYWKNYLVSEYTPWFWKKVSPIIDPISLLTWNHDLPSVEVWDAFNSGKILNASKALMQKMWMNPDRNIDWAISRVSSEILGFIKRAPFITHK